MRLGKPIPLNESEATMLHLSRYRTNKNIAIILDDKNEPEMSTSVVITVNIGDLPDHEVALDSGNEASYSINDVIKALQENKILGELVDHEHSGYCDYPVLELMLDDETIEREMMV